jgi:hypothetical protein
MAPYAEWRRTFTARVNRAGTDMDEVLAARFGLDLAKLQATSGQFFPGAARPAALTIQSGGGPTSTHPRQGGDCLSLDEGKAEAIRSAINRDLEYYVSSTAVDIHMLMRF